MGWADHRFLAGEEHRGARYTDAQIRELRRRANGGEGVRALARAYGSSPGYVSDLLSNRRRRDELYRRCTQNRELEHFLAQVQKTPGCWQWRGDRCEGRARCWFRGQRRYARDVAHELLIGQVPADRRVRLACGNPFCVRPEHFELRARAVQDTEASRTLRSTARVTDGERNLLRRPKDKHPPGSHGHRRERAA